MWLIELTEELTTSIDKEMYTVAVFVDLKKAFDTLNHGILLKKWKSMGLEGLSQIGLVVI